MTLDNIQVRTIKYVRTLRPASQIDGRFIAFAKVGKDFQFIKRNMTDLPAAAARNALAEQALSTLLTHTGSKLLSVESLGQLSIASSTLLSLTQPAWRQIFQNAVSAGSPEYSLETTTYLWRSDTLLNTWAGEDGLQSCIANPTPSSSNVYRAATNVRLAVCFQNTAPAVESTPPRPTHSPSNDCATTAPKTMPRDSSS